MDLFIQIRNGQPYEHPILGDNFRHVFPELDVNNLPPEFAKFERIQNPRNAGPYEVDEVSYQWVDGVVKDVWTVRQMTQEEKDAKFQWLLDQAINTLNHRKQEIKKLLETSLSEKSRKAWSDYLAELEAIIISDPLQFKLLSPLRLDENGEPLTITDAGSAPDVTG